MFTDQRLGQLPCGPSIVVPEIRPGEIVRNPQVFGGFPKGLLKLLGGKLVFAEHGQAPDAGVRWWQDRLTPLWRRIGGGCHLNRPIRSMIEAAGFHIDRIETGYIPGPKPMTFMYEGSARPM